MQNFTYESPTKIIFGKDTEKQVGELCKLYGNRVLLHYGGGSIKNSGLYDIVLNSLKENNIEVFELGGVMPNPRLSLAEEGIKLCRDNNIDFILAVGGGSVIDSAKGIGIGAKYDGPLWDFYSGKATVSDTLPVGVILTIPAAGSESGQTSVLTKEDGLLKRSTGNVVMRPKFAILNPELTYTLPPFQTACGITDIFVHVMERYFTNERDVDLTDRLCEGTMKTLIKYSQVVLNDPTNYPARAELMWAGTIAHNGILNTGRIGDWASHGIEHELSALYDIAHGAGLAITTPAWMKYVYKHDLNRFVQFASRVWDIDPNYENLELTALEGIKRTEEFFASLGLKTTLTSANLPTTDFEEMSSKATPPGKTLGNFVKLQKEDVLNILNLCI